MLSFKPNRFNHLLISGPPGSGKTTVAHIIGNFLRRKIIDVDNDVLEPCWGEKVQDVVKRLSQQEFFDRESRTLLCSFPMFPPHTIVSLSGSSPLHTELFTDIRAGNLCVFLNAETDTILQRLHMMNVDRIVGLREGEIDITTVKKNLAKVLNDRRDKYKNTFDLSIPVSPGMCPYHVAAQVVKAVCVYDANGDS